MKQNQGYKSLVLKWRMNKHLIDANTNVKEGKSNLDLYCLIYFQYYYHYLLLSYKFIWPILNTIKKIQLTLRSLGDLPRTQWPAVSTMELVIIVPVHQ
jgi:hypothetical protein